MQRRDFLFKSSLLAAAGLTPALSLSAQPAPLVGPSPPAGLALPPPAGLEHPAGEIIPLRRNAGIYTGFGGAIGWLSTPEALVVVDAQFPASAADFLEKLPGRGNRKVDVLINTHHHPDHTGGNSAFRPVTRRIVAQEQLPKLQHAQALREFATHFQVYAATTFSDTWSFDVGDERVTVRFVGQAAHTGSDSVVHFEKANIVFPGDLVFNRAYPNVDRLGGANVSKWIQVLEKIAADYPSDALYLFSHGKKSFGLKGTKADVLVQRDYLSGFLDFVGKGIKAGKSKEELIAATEIPGFPDWKSDRRPFFWGSSILAAWDELTNAPQPTA